MPTPSIDDTKASFTDNMKPGIAGGAAVALGSTFLGSGLGPIVGGTVAGAYVGGTDGDIVTINGMMLGANNMVSGTMGASGGSTSQQGVK